MTLAQALRLHNRFMVGFDIALGSAAIAAPGATLKVKRTPMGTYWISGPEWSESQAKFAGHGS